MSEIVLKNMPPHIYIKDNRNGTLSVTHDCREAKRDGLYQKYIRADLYEEARQQAKDRPGGRIVLTFPVRPKGVWHLDENTLNDIRRAFTRIDVEQEARKALEWIRSNPRKMKTARGMRRFLFTWMNRSNGNETNIETLLTEYMGFQPRNPTPQEIDLIRSIIHGNQT